MRNQGAKGPVRPATPWFHVKQRWLAVRGAGDSLMLQAEIGPHPRPEPPREIAGCGWARIGCRGEGARENRSAAPVQERSQPTPPPSPQPPAIAQARRCSDGWAGVPAVFCLQHEGGAPAHPPGRRLANPGPKRPPVAHPVSRETTTSGRCARGACRMTGATTSTPTSTETALTGDSRVWLRAAATPSSARPEGRGLEEAPR